MALEEHTIQSRQSVILDKPPSSIAFLPLRQDFLIVGTYHLDTGAGQGESSGSRSGSLELWKLKDNDLYA